MGEYGGLTAPLLHGDVPDDGTYVDFFCFGC
jgi:hypothetical protein